MNIALVTSQPMESITAMGCIPLRTKNTHLSSNSEALGRNTLDSEPKQFMILNKPVIEKSTFVPYSKTISSKGTSTFKHLKYFFQIVCMYIVPIPA